MQEHQSQARPKFVVRRDQPLIGVPLEEDGQEVVRYFTDEEEADQALGPASRRRARSLAGAWRDLAEWEDVEQELDRIRHESKPTPPIDL